MADILIRGMEMPSCCLMCPMYTISGCRASKRIFPDWMNVAAVPEDCPLVPLPEGHGDLIDKAEAYDKIAEQEGGNYIDMDSVGMGLEECRTIVPAEGGTEECSEN